MKPEVGMRRFHEQSQTRAFLVVLDKLTLVDQELFFRLEVCDMPR